MCDCTQFYLQYTLMFGRESASAVQWQVGMQLIECFKLANNKLLCPLCCVCKCLLETEKDIRQSDTHTHTHVVGVLLVEWSFAGKTVVSWWPVERWKRDIAAAVECAGGGDRLDCLSIRPDGIIVNSRSDSFLAYYVSAFLISFPC